MVSSAGWTPKKLQESGNVAGKLTKPAGSFVKELITPGALASDGLGFLGFDPGCSLAVT